MIINEKYQKIEEQAKDIFKESFVKVEQVTNPEICHIYIKHNLGGEQILELEKLYKILFVMQVYDEENIDAYQVILVSFKESESSLTVAEILKNTPNDELCSLFQEYQDKLVEKYKDAGIFCVDDDQEVFSDNNIEAIIEEMKL